MIKGIGIDLIELDRIQKNIEKSNKFMERVLTEEEKEIYHTLTAKHRQTEFVAGRFAAKEALGKAMGTGIGKEFSFQDISVIRTVDGAPKMKIADCRFKVWVSISHSQSHAIAQVVLED